jgi:hypothetical protein
MAELTTLEEKLAEVMGLAQAAQKATEKIAKLAESEQEDEIRRLLQRMHDEAAQTEERCLAVAEEHEGKKTAIEDKARETRQEAEQMMKTYLSGDSETLDGLEFLTMAEAGELGHVEIVREINDHVHDSDIEELVSFVLPIQERHFSDVRRAALQLAGKEAAKA